MPEPKTYAGGCHCGAVRYETTVDLAQVMECNCSHCQIKGLLLTFTDASQFTLKAGESELTEYLFNKHVIQHLFCKKCGVQSFARGRKPDGSPVIAVNVRCLQGVEPKDLKTMPFDGRNM